MSCPLTVGGFTQPGVARNLIDMPSNSEKGLSHRFMWTFPQPLYGQFSSLSEVDQAFSENIGKGNVHHTHRAINCNDNMFCT